MYIERTNYFAKPALVENVLNVRRKACRIRRSLGLPGGTIFTKQNIDGDGADVVWECGFESMEEQKRDLAVRAASPEFKAVRAEVESVIERFERHVVRTDGSMPRVGSWTGETNLEGLPIVPEQVTIPAGDGDLAGYLYLPPGDGPFPCMLTNHGSTIEQGTTDLCRPGTASLLMSWGIASLLVHRRGYGNSPGRAWRDDVSAEFGTDEYDTQLAERLDRESDDVLAGLKFVESRTEIDPAHIGVMGSSFGGTVTLFAAAKSKTFRCAVEFAGAAMNWERTPKLRGSMLAAARQVGAPIFFLQAANDYSVAPTNEIGASLEGSGTEFQARVYPAFGISEDEGHLFEKAGAAIWGKDVRRFLEKWL